MKKFLKVYMFTIFTCLVSFGLVAAEKTSPINGQGSTLSAPFVESAIEVYNALYPFPLFTYNTNPAETGSGNGYNQLISGATFFAGSDFPLTVSQQTVVTGNRILTFPIAIGATSIAFNNPDITGTLNLSANDIRNIYNGVWTNWDQVGPYPSRPIIVYARSGSTGDTFNFNSYMAPNVTPANSWTITGSTFPDPYGAVFYYATSNGDMAAHIEANEGSIGYLALGFVVSPIATAAVPQNSSGAYIVPSIATINAAIDGVPVPLDLNINGNNTSNAGGYPIASPTNIYVFQNQQTNFVRKNLQKFLRYLGTEAQTHANSFSLGQISQEMQDQYLQNICLIKRFEKPIGCTNLKTDS